MSPFLQNFFKPFRSRPSLQENLEQARQEAARFQAAWEASQKEAAALSEKNNALLSRIAALESDRASQWNCLLDYSGKPQSPEKDGV